MKKNILVFVGVMFVSVIWGHGDVLADNDDLVLSIGVTGEYLDNIFFDATDEVDDFITTLSASIEARKRTERLKAGIMGLFDAVLYADNDDLNNFDQFYNGYVEYLVNERLSISGDASFREDSRPDRDVVETGLILGTDIRKTQRYKGKVGYELTELSDVSLEYGYRKEDFDKQQNDDYDTHAVIAQWRYDLGRWLAGTKGRVTLGYSRYNYHFSSTDDYSATLGIEKELSELYKFYIDLGGRYSDYNFFNDNDLNINNDGAGGIVRSGLRYRGEYTNTNVYILHNISPASGRGRTLQRTAVVGSWRYRITEDISSDLAGGYYWNRGDLDADPFDEHTVRVAPQLIYRFADNMELSASYTYTWIDSKHLDTVKERNDFFIRFTINQTFFD